MTRSFCRLSSTPTESRVRHYEGLPPQLTGGNDTRRLLPNAEWLLIEETHEGFFIYRFLEDGTCVGDTWHQALEDALEQAKFEFGHALGQWNEIPDNVADPVPYVLERLK